MFKSLLFVLLVVGSFIGCNRTPDIIVNINNYYDTTDTKDTCPNPAVSKDVGSLSAKIIVGKVEKYGSLAKKSSINVNRLILQFTNNASYSKNDTTSISIPQGTADTITKVLDSLPALRTYKVVAKTLDQLDSVIHKDSTTFVILPADTTNVTLNLASLFTVYEANFLNIPDTVQSGTGEKSSVKVDSLVISLDASAVADSSVRPSAFVKGSNVKVTFDYVRVGEHTVKLEAFGTINDYTGLLYSGTKVILFGNSDATKTVTMSWVGPITGTGSIEVRIGKVGKVTANGTLPGTIIP